MHADSKLSGLDAERKDVNRCGNFYCFPQPRGRPADPAPGQPRSKPTPSPAVTKRGTIDPRRTSSRNGGQRPKGFDGKEPAAGGDHSYLMPCAPTTAGGSAK